MEALLARVVSRTACLVCLSIAVISAPTARAAGYRTKNFTVSAPTAQLAKEIGDTAELCRKELAVAWLGKEMPPWSKPCPISATVAPNLGAGGATSFVFDRGEVFNWTMKIQGSRERILDSVLPHEVTHTIFASHFRQPVPRWADEGACTTVENRSEIARQERNLIEFLKTGQGIPFSQMFAMKEYPANVLPLYAQGHSLTSWLIAARGRKAFLEFLADGMTDENWPRAVREHYGFESLLALQTSWNDWVKQGRPALTPDSPIVLASNQRGARDELVRGQSPDDIRPIPATAGDSPNSRSAVTLASGSESVYAAAAERAQRERQNSARNGRAPTGSNPYAKESVYATREAGILRR